MKDFFICIGIIFLGSAVIAAAWYFFWEEFLKKYYEENKYVRYSVRTIIGISVILVFWYGSRHNWFPDDNCVEYDNRGCTQYE